MPLLPTYFSPHVFPCMILQFYYKDKENALEKFFFQGTPVSGCFQINYEDKSMTCKQCSVRKRT